MGVFAFTAIANFSTIEIFIGEEKMSEPKNWIEIYMRMKINGKWVRVSRRVFLEGVSVDEAIKVFSNNIGLDIHNKVKGLKGL